MTDGYAYIDGFNLYHGLKDAGYLRYAWLDLHRFATKLLGHFGFTCGLTRYFTTRVADTHHSAAAQRIWLNAVETMAPHVKTEWGIFQDEPAQCPYCGRLYSIPREKKTDVDIGVRMLEDVMRGKPQAILLVSGDSDQVPSIAALKRRDNRYPVFIAFPPRRHSTHLSSLVGKRNTIMITEDVLEGCCLPDVVNEYIVKPINWD